MQTDNAVSSTDNGPLFFLSYAHAPRADKNDQADPDRLVAEFFRDLCRSVVQMSALLMGEGIGFMDREFRPGYEWPNRLARALATCKVFVPLYSPRYFKRPNCGMEWFAFAERAAMAGARRGEQAEVIVPAIWVPVPPEQLPAVTRRILYWTPDFSSQYATRGLYGLMSISKYRVVYEEVVHELASRILDAAEKFQLEPGPVPHYDSLRNAFDADGAESRKSGR